MKDRHALLLMRRVPRDQVTLGHAYVIHARNGGAGVAVWVRGEGLGYRLHREKFGRHYLFVEYDWDNGEPFGTAIPLLLIPEPPPSGDKELLVWLLQKEAEHEGMINAAWATVLGLPR